VGQPAEDVRGARPDHRLLAPPAAPPDLVGNRPARRVLQEQVKALPAAAVRRHGGAQARHDVRRRGQNIEHALLALQDPGKRRLHGLHREHQPRAPVSSDRHRRQRAAADDRAPLPLADRPHSRALQPQEWEPTKLSLLLVPSCSLQWSLLLVAVLEGQLELDMWSITPLFWSTRCAYIGGRLWQ
jgi:hypothetical protein